MSGSATEWAWEHSRAKNGSLIVLLAIADQIGKAGKAEMSVTELAQKTRLSDRAVQLAARDLAALGELSVTPKGGSHGRNGYRMPPWEHVRRGEDIAPLPAGRGEDIAPPKILHPEESSPRGTGHTGKPQVKRGEESAPVDNSSDMYVVPTGRSPAEVKDVPAKPPRRREDRPDADRLCDHLAARITANGNRPPRVTQKWRDAARLLIDADGITEQQAHVAIDWCQDSEFWRANILSMPKLREKYDQLRQQARRTPKAQQNGNDNLGIIGRYLERIGEE